MKTILMILSFLVSTSTLAAEINFTCEQGSETVPLLLSEENIQFQGVTLTNTLPIDLEQSYRDYSFINDPWMNISIETPMLQKQEGVIDVLIVDLQSGESKSSTYNCIPKR